MEQYLTGLLHPASVLVSIGAFCGLVASFYWLKVVRAHGRNATSIGLRFSNDIRGAAAWTALAMGLASLGYLLGRLTGEF
ncbi:hypothetical protein RXV95_05715 [Novosphingobium sp. ZN18A2]|uniref:hypothetical protein n=1 Tax=Novosphingobium sp. ZN18A2 TaxID=3079861 RepID=UPI0030CB307F